MIIFWRRLGWLVPLIGIAAMVVTQLVIDGVMGKGYYTANGWPKLVCGGLIALAIAAIGYYLNVMKRGVFVDPETGVEKKEVSHTFFFIPFQYWSVIFLVLFYLMTSSSAETKKRNAEYIAAPAVNDLYLIDQEPIFDDVNPEYSYGALKVIAVSESGVTTVASEYSFGGKSDIRKDRRDGGLSKNSDFSEQEIQFSFDELNEYLENQAIYEVIRP